MSQQQKHPSEISTKPTSGVSTENINPNQISSNNNNNNTAKRFEGLTSFAAGNVCLKSRQGGTVPKFHSNKTTTTNEYQQPGGRTQTPVNTNTDQPQQIERKSFTSYQEDNGSDWLLSNGKGKKNERLEDIHNQKKEAQDQRDKLFQNKDLFKERYQNWCESNADSLGVDSYWNELSEQFPQIFLKRPLEPLILEEDSEYYDNIEDAFEEQQRNQQLPSQQRQLTKYDQDNNLNSNPSNNFQGQTNQEDSNEKLDDDDESNWELDNSNMEFEFKVFDKEKHAQELQNKQKYFLRNGNNGQQEQQVKDEKEKIDKEGISVQQLFEMLQDKGGLHQMEKQEDDDEFSLEHEDADMRLEKHFKECQEFKNEGLINRENGNDNDNEDEDEKEEKKDDEDILQNDEDQNESQSQGEDEEDGDNAEEGENCQDEMEEDHDDNEDNNNNNEQSQSSSFSNNQQISKPNIHQQQQHHKSFKDQHITHNGQVTLHNRHEEQQIKITDPSRFKEIVISRHFTKQVNPQPQIFDSISSSSQLEFDDDDDAQEETTTPDIVNLQDLLGQAEEERQNFFEAVCYYLGRDVRELMWVYKDSIGMVYGPFDSVMMDAWSARLQDTKLSLAPQVYWVSYQELTLHAKTYALSYAQKLLLLQQNQQIQQQQQAGSSYPPQGYQQQYQQQQPLIRSYDGQNQVLLQNQIALLNQYLQDLRQKQTMCQQILNESNQNNKQLVQEQLVQFEKQNAELYSQLIQITSQLPQTIQQQQQLISSVKSTAIPQQQSPYQQNAALLQVQRSQSQQYTQQEQINVHKQGSYPGVQSQVTPVITKPINSAEKNIINNAAEPSLLTQINQQQQQQLQQIERKQLGIVDPISQIKVAAPSSNNNIKVPVLGYEKDFPSLS